MSEFEDIQRLIRLKRFEKPEEGFTENFLQQFHQRQRAEMLKQSSVELFWERATTLWENLLVPKWSLVAAAVAVCAMSLWVLSPPAAKPAAAVTVTPVVPEKAFVPKMDLSDLPMARMAKNDTAALTESLLSKQVEVRPVLQGKVPPTPSALPASGLEQPSLRNITPAIQQGQDGLLGK